jgi:CHAD domain-containing protein
VLDHVRARRAESPLIAATRWLTDLEQHVPIARAGVDPEGAHQVRVATARLRVWLALGGWRVLIDDLGWLRAHAARVRDLDVHLGRQPPEEIAQRLVSEHARAHRELCVALDSQRTSGLMRALSYMPPLSREDAAPRMAKLARLTLRRFRVATADPEDVAALHRARCALRRLRYALDWLDACPPELIALQDEVGEVGDRLAALRQLDAVADANHGRAYHRELTRELRRHARAARRMWQHVEPRCEELTRWTCS